jgi:hypothetical protein
VPVFFYLGDQSCKLVSWRLFYHTLCDALELAKTQNMFDAVGSLLPSVDICMPFVLAETLRIADLRSHPSRLLPMFDQLLDIILMQRMWQTSDPRDCVYVLRGIHPMFRELQVRYSDSIEEVFSDATTILLQIGGTWSRVCWTHPSESAYLPSWVVDFSSSCIHMSMATQILEKSFLEGGMFNASASSTLRVQVPAPQILSTAGFIFDEIVDITRSLTHLERISDFDDSRWAEWVQFVIKHDHLLRKPVQLLRTICAGMAPEDKAFRPEDIKFFWDSPIGELYDLEQPGPPEIEQKTEAVEAWRRSVCAFMLQKRFFVTKGGRTGLAHRSTTVGVHVAIFASGDIPFVLRRAHSDAREEAYILIGGCYLDGKSHATEMLEQMNTDGTGAMYGEAVYEEAQRIVERRQSYLGEFPERRPWLEMMASLDLGCRVDKALAEDSPYQQHRVLKRRGSLDSVGIARAKAVKLAFKDYLHLV